MNDDIKILTEKILWSLENLSDYDTQRKYLEDELTNFKRRITEVRKDNRADEQPNENRTSDRTIIGTYPIYSAEDYFTPDERISEE